MSSLSRARERWTSCEMRHRRAAYDGTHCRIDSHEQEHDHSDHRGDAAKHQTVIIHQASVAAEAATSEVQKDNQRDENDDPEEDIPPPGCSWSNLPWAPRRGRLKLLLQSIGCHSPRLVHGECRGHQQHKQSRACVTDKVKTQLSEIIAGKDAFTGRGCDQPDWLRVYQQVDRREGG